MVIYGGMVAGSVAQPWRTWLVRHLCPVALPS